MLANRIIQLRLGDLSGINQYISPLFTKGKGRTQHIEGETMWRICYGYPSSDSPHLVSLAQYKVLHPDNGLHVGEGVQDHDIRL